MTDRDVALAIARSTEIGARAEREALERELGAANDDGRAPKPRAKPPRRPSPRVARPKPPDPAKLAAAGVTDLDVQAAARDLRRRGA